MAIRDYEKEALVHKYPYLIPHFENYNSEKEVYSRTGPMDFKYGYGTSKNGVDYGYGRDHKGLYVYGTLRAKNSTLPILKKEINTPIGRITLKNSADQTEIYAHYQPNEITNSVLEALLLAYRRNKVYNENRHIPPALNFPMWLP